MNDHLKPFEATTVQCEDGSSLAVRHAWCVGRNYAAHAREMGANPEAESPLFFSKPASALVQQQQIEYPPNTQELHHEVELLAILGSGGRDLTLQQATECITGWAVGCDLTRRDVQAQAKKSGHPWALSKGFDQSGPLGQVTDASSWQPRAEHVIGLRVNGELRQSATLAEMIWSVPVLLSRLSQEISLHGGDVLFTGTPAGVAELVIGDRVEARIDGLPPLNFQIVEPSALS